MSFEKAYEISIDPNHKMTKKERKQISEILSLLGMDEKI